MPTISTTTTVVIPVGKQITVSGNGTIDIIKGFGAFDSSSVYINGFERTYGPIGTIEGLVRLTPKTSMSYAVSSEVFAVSEDADNALTQGSDGLPFLDQASVSGAISDQLNEYPIGQISDANFAGWTKLGGGGNSSVVASPVAGFAARITTNGTASGYVVAQKPIYPLTLSATDVVSVRVNVLNANNTRNIRITLSNDAASSVRAYIIGFQAWTPGVNVASFKIADCTFAGGATAATVWNYIQFDVTNPTYATQTTVDIGPAWVGGAAKTPLVTIGFDAAYEKVYNWAYKAMRAHGLVGHLYAKPSSVGLPTHMSLAQYQECYAAGWSIGKYVNIDNMGANNHTKDGICSQQSVSAGAGFVINGTYASGGVATLDVPRVVTVYIPSGNEGSNSFTITGTDGAGNALSEIISGPTSMSAKAYTRNKYKTVTSVVATALTSVTPSIGTGFTQEEYITQHALQQQWLNANGFTRGAMHFAYALGEFNHESEAWLDIVGMKTARTVTTGNGLMRNQIRGVPVNERFISCAVTMGDPGSNASVQTQVNNAITRGHDVHILGHLGGAVAPDQAELNATIAWLGSLHRAGTIRVVPFDEYERIKGI